jgi:2-haloalkanoic acid dehalogenase type II
MPYATPPYDAILFDLLTALIDSWSLWNRVAGGEDAGRTWRIEYLHLTYGCGVYRPYEALVSEAALASGLNALHAAQLEASWDELQPWDDAPALLRDLAPAYRLGVVTNCSERLGQRAAARLQAPFECIVTAERAGNYKPDPAPYRLALRELGLPAERVLFVAGSGFDLFGTARVGLATLWHNRVGLAAPDGAPAPIAQARTLRPMVDDFLALQRILS